MVGLQFKKNEFVCDSAEDSAKYLQTMVLRLATMTHVDICVKSKTFTMGTHFIIIFTTLPIRQFAALN